MVTSAPASITSIPGTLGKRRDFLELENRNHELEVALIAVRDVLKNTSPDFKDITALQQALVLLDKLFI